MSTLEQVAKLKDEYARYIGQDPKELHFAGDVAPRLVEDLFRSYPEAAPIVVHGGELMGMKCVQHDDAQPGAMWVK